MNSHSKTTNSIRNMIHNSTSSFAQLSPNSTYNRKRTKKRNKSKPPKKTNCDVNLYKYPGRKIFESSEIVEKALSVIWSGTITLMENYSANNGSAEVALFDYKVASVKCRSEYEYRKCFWSSEIFLGV